MFDAATARIFWGANWPFLIILFLILAGLDFFYFTNRRLFTLLEREDWPALVTYLEGKVFRRGQYRSRLVGLLSNTYLVLQDFPAMLRLENQLAVVKPSLLEEHALVFGLARILGKDFTGAARFFKGLSDKAKAVPDRSWIIWFYGFSLFLSRQMAQAADQFVLLAKVSGDALPAGLAAFFLADTLQKSLPERREEFLDAAEAALKRVKKSLPQRAHWEKERGRLKTEIYTVVISKYLDDAGNWLYA